MLFHSLSKNFFRNSVVRGVICRNSLYNMDSTLHPSDRVRGMKVLDKTAFNKRIQVPTLTLGEADINKILPAVKKNLLKMEKLRPVQNVEGSTLRRIFLHPSTKLEDLSLSPAISVDFKAVELELTYENWRAGDLLKAILPTDQDQLTSFSRVGHIIHLNLRDHLLEYKQIIAEILREKTVGVRTIVNKSQGIDNTYRNFQLELLAGEADYKVEVKENGITFEFDFSSVYWNPRLSCEHERIVALLQPGDVLYDCFAGVGPFAIPAAKKGCRVLANDLNPESYTWLLQNIRRNKVTDRVTAFNKDASDFILQDVREDFLRNPTANVHITMNLPAMATTFLNTFVGLLKEQADCSEPTVHVYCFTQCENNAQEGQKLAETGLGRPISKLLGVHFVRSVAPNKDMMRVDFKLTPDILLGKRSVEDFSQSQKKCNEKKSRGKK